MSGCGSVSSTIYGYNYAVIKEKDKYVLHKVKYWKTFSINSVGIKTDCCNNKIWFSNTNGTLYENKPDTNNYDIECNQKSK